MTPCSALQLHLREAWAEGSTIKVLANIFHTCERINEYTIKLPETLSSHLSLQNPIVSAKNLYSVLAGHLNIVKAPEIYSCRTNITNLRPRITWNQMIRRHFRNTLASYSDEELDLDHPGDSIKKRWLRQTGQQTKRTRSSSDNNTADNTVVGNIGNTTSQHNADTPTSSNVDADTPPVVEKQPEITEICTQQEAPVTSTHATQQEAPPLPSAALHTQQEQVTANTQSEVTANVDHGYYFLMEPDQTTQVFNFQPANVYPYTPTYTTLTSNTPTVTYTHLNQYVNPTVTYTAAPVIYTQQLPVPEMPTATVDVTPEAEDLDSSIEITRYSLQDIPNDPHLHTTHYSSVGQDSDNEQIEPRRVRISMELIRATKLIQKKLTRTLDEFNALHSGSSSGSSDHNDVKTDPTESEVDRMLASSEEDSPKSPQAAEHDITNIPPDFHFPPTENFQPIVESIIKENTRIGVYNILSIIRAFPQLCIKLATQVHEHIAAGKKVPLSAKTFLYKNRSKVLFGQLEKHVKERHASSRISWLDVSFTEVETFTLATPPADQLDYERYRLGPVTQTITGEPVPQHIVKSSKAVMVAFSEVYTNIDDRYIANLLNMAPGRNLYYTGEDTADNTLLAYLRKVQEQMGEDASLPIVVEFAPTKYINYNLGVAMKMVRDFCATLAIFQENYPGLVLSLACPPYYDVTYSLPAYQRLKGINSRITEYLTAYGLCFGIFMLNPPIVSPPVNGPDGFTGFLIEKSFCRAPLFTKTGHNTTELERRAIRGLREEMEYVRSIGFI